MKRFRLTILFSMLLTVVCFADEFQDRPRFSPQEFMQKREEFIIKKAGLSPAEAASFFPLYRQFEKEKMKIEKKIGGLMHKAFDSGVDEKEAQSIISEIDKLQLQKVKLENSYHQKYRKAITAQKILRVFQADWLFSRHVLKQMAKPRHERPRPKIKQPHIDCRLGNLRKNTFLAEIFCLVRRLVKSSLPFSAEQALKSSSSVCINLQ